MANDLFAQNNISPNDDQGNDLFEQEGISPNQPSTLSNVENYAKGVGQNLINNAKAGVVGIANGVRGLLNVPSDIANTTYDPNRYAALAKTSPQLANALTAITPTPNEVMRVPNYDWNKTVGLNNPNVIQQGIENVGSYIPYAIPANDLAGSTALSARMGAQGLGGMAYNATQSNNPTPQSVISGGLAGAGTELGLGTLGAGINKLGQVGKNWLLQFPASPMYQNIKNYLDNDKMFTNQQAFNVAQNNLGKVENNEQNLWENGKQLGNTADKQGKTFDESNYNDKLDDKISQLTNQSNSQSGYARANKDAINLLNDYKNDTHNTFTDAFEHNKALNQDYKNEIAPGQPLPFKMVNFAKSNLSDTIEDNIKRNGLDDTLGKAWRDANQATQDKNNTFFKISNEKGKDQPSSFATFLNNKSPYNDPSTFVNDYLPKKGEGTQKMEQFGKMLGDHDYAMGVLRKNYFSDADTPEKLIKFYDDLSPDQQKMMISSDANNQIKYISKTLKESPNALNHGWAMSLFNHMLPSLVGTSTALGAHHLGANIGSEAAMAGMGLIGGNALGWLGNKALANPTAQRIAMNAFLKPGVPTFRSTLMNAFKRGINPLAIGAAVPYSSRQ